MLYGAVSPAPHQVQLRAEQQTGLFAFNLSPEIRAIIEGPLHTGQVATHQRALQPECFGPQCPRFLRTVPAHLNVDGALVAHLWVCPSCGCAQTPLLAGQGLPIFPAATAGLATHPMLPGRRSRTRAGTTPPPLRAAPMPALYAAAEITPVPEGDTDDSDP